MANISILHDPRTTLHHSVELLGHKIIDSYESPDRIHRILQAVAGEKDGFTILTVDENEDKELNIPLNIHSSPYIDHLRTIFGRFLEEGSVQEDGCVLPECFPHRMLLQAVSNDESISMKSTIALPQDPFAHLGHYSFDMSTGISKYTFSSAIAASKLGIKGVDVILEGAKNSSPIAFCLTRPPGHHACHALAGGYCYINNIAVAAEYLLSKLPTHLGASTQSRVVILDLDVHHGNGTQSIFYTRREPAYISIHGEGAYPYYTGDPSEEGSGEGQGYNRNLPLPLRPKSSREDYLSLLDTALKVVKDEWRGEYLLVSMGFDTFWKDVLGGFELDMEDYTTIGSRIRELGLPVLVLLEGGYSEELGRLVVRFLEGLRGGKV